MFKSQIFFLVINIHDKVEMWGRGDNEVIIHATGSHSSMITSPNAL
jgi:hypothetical protein